MEYALIKSGQVVNVIVADDSFVSSLEGYDHIEPLDTYQEASIGVGIGWGWDGGFIEPPKPPEPEPQIPQVVTRFQALAALHGAGLLASVKSYMSKPETPVIEVLAFEEAQSFERNSPMVNAIAQLLKLDSSQVDSLFVAASQIKA